jgi:hypothetical protein
VRQTPPASLDFFAGLSENVRARIYAELSQEKFAAKRDDLHSVWHLIHPRYEQQFDPLAYLRSCEKHLANDWHYGESLIDAAISRGDFVQAETFIEQTFVSLLGGSYYKHHALSMKALSEVNCLKIHNLLDCYWSCRHHILR